MHDSFSRALPGDDPALVLDQEARWIAAAQADPTAFEPLYLLYRARIYHYLRTRLANEEDAADMTQQVFLQALAALPQYRQGGTPFVVWLFRIARNIAINLSSRHPGCVSWDALPETFCPVEDTEQDPETLFLRQEAIGHLKALLASLDPEKRELLALRFAGGLNSSQISTLVGKKPEAVKKQINRLLQSFKERYQHEYP
jgi:RNA polymerase sigma-70 factor (ECF subfamily)